MRTELYMGGREWHQGPDELGPRGNKKFDATWDLPDARPWKPAEIKLTPLEQRLYEQHTYYTSVGTVRIKIFSQEFTICEYDHDEDEQALHRPDWFRRMAAKALAALVGKEVGLWLSQIKVPEDWHLPPNPGDPGPGVE